MLRECHDSVNPVKSSSYSFNSCTRKVTDFVHINRTRGFFGTTESTKCSGKVLTLNHKSEPSMPPLDSITDQRMEKESDFRCVECSCPIKSLYIQYSPGNIRLMKCGNCKMVADKYIECEVMIILIDLILHKPKAYRHLFYNTFTRDILDFGVQGLVWKLLLGFLMLDSYRIWVLNANESESISLMSFAAVLRSSGKILIDVVLGNFLFISVVLFGSAKFLNTSVGGLQCKDTVLTMPVSSYFKIFIFATMVWEFPSCAIIMIDIFVLSSNTVALKVIVNSATIRCFGVCFAAHAVKFFVSEGLRTLHLS